MTQSRQHLAPQPFVFDANRKLTPGQIPLTSIKPSEKPEAVSTEPNSQSSSTEMLIYYWKKRFSELCRENKGTIEPTVRSVCFNGLFIQAQQQSRHLSQELGVSQNSSDMEMEKCPNWGSTCPEVKVGVRTKDFFDDLQQIWALFGQASWASKFNTKPLEQTFNG